MSEFLHRIRNYNARLWYFLSTLKSNNLKKEVKGPFKKYVRSILVILRPRFLPVRYKNKKK